MFNFLLAFLGTYVFYKQGMAYMFQARLLDDYKARRRGYRLLMIAGIFLGEYVGITGSHYFFPGWLWGQILGGTVSSILLGEGLYLYSKWFARKLPSVQERKNY